jgi:hypothetical protein
MAVQTPTPVPEHEPTSSATGWRVIAASLWLLTTVVGIGGGWLVFGLAEAGAGFFPWYLVVALPFGLLLGGAVVATMLASSFRASIPIVLVTALLAGVGLHTAAGMLGEQSARRLSSEACSAAELDQFETLSFYGDLDQTPTGTQFESCYALITLDGTGEQAWVDLDRLLVDNGWEHPWEPDWEVHDAGVYEPFHWLYQSGFVLTVHPEGAHDLPGDVLTESDDGATTFALDLQTSPCSQRDVDLLQPLYEGLSAAAGLSGDAGPGVELVGSSPDEPCRTVPVRFESTADAERALRDRVADGWTLTGQESGRSTFERDGATIEATITEEVEDPEAPPIAVTLTVVQ